MALWGGRFKEAPDAVFREINDSLAVDWRLVEHDIAASIAWARALSTAGALSQRECEDLCSALADLCEEAAATPDSPIESGAEDVHTWVEDRLVKRLGDLGKKLHLGRSRNDQVATDLRLFLRASLHELHNEIGALQRALLDLAHSVKETPIPGYTHLQRAQPVLFAHWALSHVEALERDADRMQDARRRADTCPLGSGALAGTTVNVDREQIARNLGFASATRNSLDAAASRDFVAEPIAACAIAAINLSHLAEDIILYASTEFGFVTLADAYASGSSLMPQKKNPDALELIRAKSGRLIGVCAGFLATLKGLPSSYNKDLQEDKSALFNALDTLSLCLRAATGVVSTLSINKDRCADAAGDPALLATELADALASRGVPFREAHAIVGEIVTLASDRNCSIADLSLDDHQAIDTRFTADDLAQRTLPTALARRRALGGTAPTRVQEAIESARIRLEETRRAAAQHRDCQRASAGVRLRPARLAEVSALCNLINFWADQGRTMQREPDEVAFSLRNFVVATCAQDSLIGCGALRLTNGGLAEVCSVAMDPNTTRAGVGGAIVRYLQDDARALGVATLFLATDVPAFFQTCGFTPVERDFIPDEAWIHPVLKAPRKADTVMIWRPADSV